MDKKQRVQEFLAKFDKNERTKIPEEDLAAFTSYLYANLDNISIGNMSDFYIYTREGQNKLVEYTKICKFLDGYVQKYARDNGLDINDLDLQFINYGRTELVYVLTEKKTGKRTTLLTKQPVVEFGAVREECDNLRALAENDSMVVAPIDYYARDGQELYATPYIHQARCVASDYKWGMYIPEPIYRFENFTPEQESVVNTCMIAKLISLYDSDKKQGIGTCRLGGGDFMLPKDWERNSQPTIGDTLSKLYLIAARKMVPCSLEQYENILRDEFSRRTINEKDGATIVNHRGRVPMSPEDIESGITLGRALRLEKSNPTNL